MTNQEIDHRYPANNWFRTWFNSPYYHKLYQQHNDQEAWEFISRLVDYLQIPITEEVLDLACGKGRHARSFNKLGYQVTGLDLSEESILAAKAMAIADHAEH
jgi:2-polyprenyl-3-methyl-5-hydroxy-6-metoxy-1,4-benzoquinol methylase